MSVDRPSRDDLDRREQHLRALVAGLEHADCFEHSGAQRRRINEELAHIARWREILADETQGGLYRGLRASAGA